MLKKYNFYDRALNKHSSFANDFVDNGDGTITDRATGLMWERGGSPSARIFKRSKFYVKKLNEDKFAGYSDWRLPTVEELASLLKKDDNNGIHIDPLFAKKQRSCWSADMAPDFVINRPIRQVWVVSFEKGKIGTRTLYNEVWSHRPAEHNYVRAVRSITSARISLRSEPKLYLDKHIEQMLKKYNFFENDRNAMGSFKNDFVDNGNGTITDRATGLMWQKSGSSKTKKWKRAQTYVIQLNKDRFAGYLDWRLPTIEELASLVERRKIDGVHIDPIFDKKQKTCWSSDTMLTDPPGELYHTWIVNFAQGAIRIEEWSKLEEKIALYPFLDDRYHIRVVRSLKEQ
jgi:hypothetical protein